jgi:hypothetical protein
MIESNDIFSWAATQRYEASGRDLVAPGPLPVPNRILPLDRQPGASAFKPAKKLNKLEDVHRELARSRRRMARFLADLVEPMQSCRISLPLEHFDWREETDNDRRDFLSTLAGAGQWLHVSIPHYGPPLGRAVTYYRTKFEVTAEMVSRGALFAVFDGVDYKAHVFVNGTFLGSHEGFFAPFEFDFTSHAHPGTNYLVVKVENDHVCMGSIDNNDRQTLDGDKIYAATGLGYNDPKLGWHHCPPGMGIYQGVRIEARPRLFIHDIFVRPLPDEGCAEAWIEVSNCDLSNTPVTFELSLFGQNFKSVVFRNRRVQPTTTGIRGHGDVDKELLPVIYKAAGPGFSQFRMVFKIPHARRWEPATPWLYQLQVKLLDEQDRVCDVRRQQFGMRTFRQDENSTPKGKFYLNDQEIRLRGANTMGYEQLCVFRKDWSQLIDDILLAKLCNINFLRLTQRPVQREVYEYCDRLGLMTQTDLPLFGCLHRNQLCEAARQTEEMERLIRSHPCNILISYINEPFPNGQSRPHRNLTRDELEQFFDMASQVVRMSNPERVIKCVEGDYDPPTTSGMPDNHCYCGWYIGHGIDLGRLNRGYWLPIKTGWHYGCGEFGAEGLDSLEVMREYYPEGWLPAADQKPIAPWRPEKLSGSQTNRFQYLWFPAQSTPEAWIEASQQHQAFVTRTMTEAFRRDWRMNTFAIHLFIDAWPCGWMKAIMDVRRIPKKAFFAYREALTPLMVSLRADRRHYFADETVEMEAWICNDSHEVPHGGQILYQLEIDGRVFGSGRADAKIPRCSSRPQGLIRFQLPQRGSRINATIRLALADKSGKILFDTSKDIEVFPRLPKADAKRMFVVGQRNGPAVMLAKELGLAHVRRGKLKATDVIAVDDPTVFARRRSAVEAAVKSGATVLFLELPVGKHSIAEGELSVVASGMGQRHFVDCCTGHALVADFQPYDCWFWHDRKAGYPMPLLATVLDTTPAGWSRILESGNGSWITNWKSVSVAIEKRFGQGVVRVCQIKLTNRLATNPSAAILARRLLDVGPLSQILIPPTSFVKQIKTAATGRSHRSRDLVSAYCVSRSRS